MPRCLSLLSLLTLVAACADDAPASAPALLRQCVSAYGQTQQSCYQATGESCAEGDVGTAAALNDLRAGFGRLAEPDLLGLADEEAVIERLQSACASQASSVAWRSYGGPQGAVYSAGGEETQACLVRAHEVARDYIDESLSEIDLCLASSACDPSAVASRRAQLATEAAATIETACARALASQIAINPATFIARAAHQVDCLAATAHSSVAPLELSCGPENADFDAPRGVWTRIPVDSEKWGTRCGDGSDYSFWIRLAPEGEPLDQVLIGLQGGGVCVFEEDCAARLAASPGLFTADDDEPLSVGIASNDPEVSPFANYTKVYLPYCTQDVFAGGGVVENLGSVQLPRFGSVNLRASIQMVRDLLWQKMDAEGEDGFRSDKIIALFGGWSAGAYGTLYNYHWLLDDLQWPRTIAFPDAGMALDNGSPLGVSGIGLLKLPSWGFRPMLPPYCFIADCAVGPVLYEAISPRLLQVPEQQMLIVSNPKDDIQRQDAFFDNDARWINATRQAYCDTKDLPGIQYYLTSVSEESLHVVTIRPELWSGSVDGVVMSEWFGRAVSDPSSITDRAEEGDFVSVIEPFPCDVAP